MDEFNQAKKEYQKAFWVYIGVVLACLAVIFVSCHFFSRPVLIIIAVLLALVISPFQRRVKKASAKQHLLKRKAKGTQWQEYPRTGLYKEVFDLCRGDRQAELFDPWTTVQEIYDDGESLDIQFLRAGVEGGVEFQQESLYLWLDIGEEGFKEETLPLSQAENMEALKKIIRHFMEENCKK